MNFNEVYTRGGYRCQSAGDRRWKQARPLICQKTARYINFFFSPHQREREREIEEGVEEGGGAEMPCRTRSIGRRGGEGGERGMEGGSKGGRQLLKAIALPPGCLRRAESVEMLNLA